MQAISIPKINTVIINVYRPFGDFNTFLETIEDTLKSISDSFPNCDIVMVGDFNTDLSISNSQANKLVESCLLHDLLQQVTLPTRIQGFTKTLIDHVYTKTKQDWKSDVILCDISDHYATITVSVSHRASKASNTVTKRWFTAETYEQMQILLRHEDWSPMRLMNCDNATNDLLSTINTLLDIVAPIETKTLKVDQSNDWITPGISNSLATQAKLFRQFKTANTPESCTRYKKYKKLLGCVIRQAKALSIEENIIESGNDTRKIWAILNEVVDRKQIKFRIPEKFNINGRCITDQKQIADTFNYYFATIGSNMADQLPNREGYKDYVNRSYGNFQLARPHESIIREIMKHQQPKLSCGVDTINNRLVKSCCNELAVPMEIIIGKSIEDCIVPLAFKIARIIPLYKKGPQMSAETIDP